MPALLWKDCRRILSRVGRKAIPSPVFRWPWFCFSSSCLSFGFLDELGAAAMAVADSAAVVLEAAVLVEVVEALAALGAVVPVAAARVAVGNEVNGRRNGSGNKPQ